MTGESIVNMLYLFDPFSKSKRRELGEEMVQKWWDDDGKMSNYDGTLSENYVKTTEVLTWKLMERWRVSRSHKQNCSTVEPTDKHNMLLVCILCYTPYFTSGNPEFELQKWYRDEARGETRQLRKILKRLE